MSPGDASGDASATVLGLDFRTDRVAAAVVAFAALALLARLVGLGARPFHWDEARVGYWTLRYLETGAFEYRPVAGGPLLYHLDRVVFAVLGASDAMARLPVAVLGAALPSCALLFRDRLDDAETLAFAAVLAFHPLLVYYSRFLRGDVPLVLFALAFVGFVVRAFDRASRRDAYAAAVALALAFASSGFAAAYVLCWVAVGVLLVDQPSAVVDGGASARRLLASLRSRVAGRTAPAARASLLFLGTTVLMFAPRAGPHVEVGLTRPTTWHLVLYESTVGALWSFVGVRVVNRWPAWTHELFPYVADLLGTLGDVALPTAVAAVAVFAWNRYVATERRTLLDAFAYWAAASVAVFPVVTEVAAPWVAIHVLLPLAPLAAVGAAAFLRHAVALARGDGRDAAAVAGVCLLLVAVLAQAGAVTAAGVYGPSDRTNELAQFAQPSDDLDPLFENASAVADGDPTTPEVLYVGERYYTAWDPGNEFPPVVQNWGNRLPLPWYFERAGADAISTKNVTTFDERAANRSTPPMVVAAPSLSGAVGDRLGDGYEATTYHLGLWDREVVVFVRR
ncbi:TIGR03663 family protein [Halogeometricum rufum]|uniref:TIGR03663 family protein n=1 Tax=Halogeometricum rufum TaxID=553469 RepID=A0A1I6GZU1_9EURY|nr:flippase activity-associated protein Agl23 [Halogeometricum rufum]SFR47716.1 TIGR03663 family protein [Halogeometricum rufum]